MRLVCGILQKRGGSARHAVQKERAVGRLLCAYSSFLLLFQDGRLYIMCAAQKERVNDRLLCAYFSFLLSFQDGRLYIMGAAQKERVNGRLLCVCLYQLYFIISRWPPLYKELLSQKEKIVG